VLTLRNIERTPGFKRGEQVMVSHSAVAQYHSAIDWSAAAWCDLFRKFRTKEIAFMKSKCSEATLIGKNPGVCVIADKWSHV
jgi:hypothetical protein